MCEIPLFRAVGERRELSGVGDEGELLGAHDSLTNLIETSVIVIFVFIIGNLSFQSVSPNFPCLFIVYVCETFL